MGVTPLAPQGGGVAQRSGISAGFDARRCLRTRAEAWVSGKLPRNTHRTAAAADKTSGVVPCTALLWFLWGPCQWRRRADAFHGDAGRADKRGAGDVLVHVESGSVGAEALMSMP